MPTVNPVSPAGAKSATKPPRATAPRAPTPRPAAPPGLSAAAADSDVTGRRLYTHALVHFFSGFPRARDRTVDNDS